MMVSAPRRAHTLPSSKPMTPAPITPRRRGVSANSNAPSESTMALPSNGAWSISMGTEPGASTTCSAASIAASPSAGVYSTAQWPCNRPWPGSHVTPLPSNRPATPWVSFATTASFCAIILATFIDTPSASMPRVAKPVVASTNLCDASSSALDGMQPQFKQVPPKVGWPAPFTDLSMQATRVPSWAARIAAA